MKFTRLSSDVSVGIFLEKVILLNFKIFSFFTCRSFVHLRNLVDLLLPVAEDILAGRYTAISNRIQYFTLLHNYGLHIGHIGAESLNLDPLAMALPKRSPLLVPFNWA